MNVCILLMLYCDKIDVSEGTDHQKSVIFKMHQKSVIFLKL